MKIENLIAEIIALKAAYPNRTLDEIIRVRAILATENLTLQIQRLVSK